MSTSAVGIVGCLNSPPHVSPGILTNQNPGEVVT